MNSTQMERPSTAGLGADNALDDRHQLTDIHRLDDMIEKTHFPTTPLILVHAVTAQSDAFDPVTVAKLFHQIVAGPVGQPQVANDDVKPLGAGELQCCCHAAGCLDRVVRSLQ